MTVPILTKVDWNPDGDFSDSGEDVSDRVDGSAGQLWSRGKDQIRQFAPAAAGQCGFVLNNLSRDYSPGNSSSPLIGLVVPGRKVRLETSGEAGGGFEFVDGTDFNFVDGTDFEFTGMPGRVIWSGLVDDISHHPEMESRNVSMVCLGNLSKLRGKFVSTGLHQDILTSDFLEFVLDAAGWPDDERDIQTGLTTITWAWADNLDAFDLVQIIKDTEGAGASVYEDPDGFIVFENRDSRTTQTRSTVSQATFLDTESINGLQYNPNFKDTVQAATLTVQERAAQGQSVIWELGDTLTLTSFEVRRMQVRSNSGDPFMSAILPSPAPNDTIQTLTGDATLTAGTFKVRFREETAVTAIDWDSTAAEIETSLETLTTIGSGNVTCFGGPINTSPVSVQFVGIFSGQSITDLIEIVDSTLNPVSAPASIVVTEEQRGDGIQSEIQALRPSSVLTGGGPYTVTVDLTEAGGGIVTSGGIAYNAVAATVQTTLRALSGMGSCLVTGGPLSSGAPFLVNLIYSDDLPLMEIGGTAVTASVPTANINVAITTQGGVPDYVITAGSIDFALDRQSGARVMLTATAGSTGGTATGLRMRGSLVSIVRTHEVAFPEDVTDIPAGKIQRLNSLPEITLETARQQVEGFVSRYKTSHPTVVFTVVRSIYNSANDELFEREISDRITIVEAQTGINEDYHIEQIRQSIQGLTLVTEFGCEQIVNAGNPPLFWY